MPETCTFNLQKLRAKYPGKVPIVLGTDLDLAFKKFLVPPDSTLGEFQCNVRTKCRLPPEESLCFFVNRTTLHPVSPTLGTLYAQYVPAQDDVLHIYVCAENTFGGGH